MKALIIAMLIGLLVISIEAAVSVTTDTVIDTDNNLEWQLENPGKMRWRDGVTYCKNLKLKNKSDWRLPDKKTLELGSKLATYFTGIKPVFFWTSTDYEPDREKSWLVNLVYGFLGYDDGGFSYDVKCVRTFE